MISYTHIEVLRQQVAEAERVLAGWKYMLAHAEQVERGGTVMPDPLMPAGQPWPAPPLGRDPYPASCACGEPNDPAKIHDRIHCGIRPREMGGPDVYPATSVMPPIDGSTLPPNQENALGTIAQEHDAYNSSPDGVKEDKKWRAS